MIKTQTLFILGAGASKPFGYPTGEELRREILFTGQYDNAIVNVLNRSCDDKKPFYREIKEFKEAFSGAGVYSIDSFLEHRPEFMDIGKMFIAQILISRENDNTLRRAEDSWYMYLFNRMAGTIGELDQNNISFVTFNYDRSLEYFLFKAIQNQFGLRSEVCKKIMKSFPIVHLYGQLDLLPWQEPDGKEYSSKNSPERLNAAPQNIKLISDERDIENSEYFQKAYKLIEDAERIFFLGFSFDETNLKRLNLNSIEDNKEIVATVYGIEPTKLRPILEYFGQSAHTFNTILEDMDTLTLLKNRLEFE